jgi:SAM-dependent methyltransferase
MISRRVSPEILDTLEDNDPAALRNRRDLRRLNAVMGNHRWLCNRLEYEVRPGDRVLELGAGDGWLLRQLARRLCGRGVAITGLDRCGAPTDLPPEAEWIQADLLEFADWSAYSVIVVNLLLHQFEDEALRTLGARMGASARCVIGNETVRGPWHSFMARVSFLLGMGPVSRHDAVVSVRAGFRPGELASLLGLTDEAWQVEERISIFSALRFCARREGVDAK